MPLSVALTIPGQPDTPVTAHTHHVHRSTADLAENASLALATLEHDALAGLRWVSECIACELATADVSVTQYPDGSVEATARVLCDDDLCARVARAFHRSCAEQEAEAEAARAWAALALPGQGVQLYRRPDEEEPTPPGTPADPASPTT